MLYLTSAQHEKLDELADEVRVVGEKIGLPVLEFPDGKRRLLAPDGKLLAARRQ